MDELPISTNSKDDQYQELLERILEEYSLKDEISEELNEGSIASSPHTEIESKTVKTIFGVFQIYRKNIKQFSLHTEKYRGAG